MSEVEMTIPIDSLLKLPSLASYYAKQGQASAKVTRDDGNIIVYASCDSLQELVWMYMQENATYKQRNDELQKESSALTETVSEWGSNRIKMLFVGFMFGLMGGIVSTILFIKRKKNNYGQ